MGKRSAVVYSIFGQIEAAAAEHLIKDKKATRIEPHLIPQGDARVNTEGQPALFAVVVPGEHIEEFEELIANLRA